MSPTIKLGHASDISHGMVLNGRIVYSTSFNEVTDIITVELGSRGAPIRVPLTERIVLVEDDGPRTKVLRGWPADASPLAEDEFSTFCHRRDILGVKKRSTTTLGTHTFPDDPEAIATLRAGSSQRMVENHEAYEAKARERRDKAARARGVTTGE